MDTTTENFLTRILSREDLVKLEKEDLADKVISMQAHIRQLQGLLNKQAPNGKKTSTRPGRTFEFSQYKQRHIFLRFLYLGGSYEGYVVQEATLNTVEEKLFEALIKTKLITSRETANYHRCGRTDKGVSAFCQVVSLTVRSRLKQGPGLIVPEGYTGEPVTNDAGDTGTDAGGDQIAVDLSTAELDYISALNGVLPKDIRVIAWAPMASTTTSARFDCRRRRYHYYFPRGQLQIERMHEACQHLIGSHDFRNLCKMDINNGVLTYIRRVFAASVTKLEPTFSASADGDDSPYSMCLFQIEASAFLWHQIRCIMAVLFLIGLGREEPSIIARLLDIEAQPARPQYGLAPDLPLVLYAAAYDTETVPRWLYGRNSTVLQTTITSLHEQWTRNAVQAAITRSMIGSLVEEYNTAANADSNDQDSLLSFANLDSAPRAFLAGVNTRTYVPLLSRQLCDSLENRLEKKSKCSQKKRIKLDM